MNPPPDTDTTTTSSEEVLTPVQAAKLAEDEARRIAREKAGDALVFLNSLRKGEFAVELADALQEVTRAVREHHRGGTVTVKLDIKPLKGATDVVTVTDSVAVKAPRGERPASVRFTTNDGALLVDQPNQYAAFTRDQLSGGPR